MRMEAAPPRSIAGPIPEWGETRPRACPFCAGEATACFTRADGLPIARCDRCACWFAARVPSEERLAAFYAGYQQHRAQDLSTARARFLRRHAEGLAERDPVIALLRESGALPGGRILDVGAGAGAFLASARAAGGTVAGCELDGAQARFARERLHLDVREGGIESRAADERFHAITLLDVLEHPLDPLALLGAAAARLVPGGLLVAWTPNGDDAPAADPASWPGFAADLEHLQYLSPHTAALVATALGLRLRHVEALGRSNLARPPRPSVFGRLRGALDALAGRPPPPAPRGRFHLLVAWQRPGAER
jgi:2-polyprenyl-3-methyl-5-hydroxy-6-metoxy-1,4-benzoquinol methylase